MVEKRNAYRLLVGKPEGERALGRPRRMCVCGYFRERLGLCELNWCSSGKGQVESCCECGYEPSGSIKCWETIKWLLNGWPLE
jgi:hypothetical protein